MSEPRKNNGFPLRRRALLMLGLSLGLGVLALRIWRRPRAPSGFVLLEQDDAGLLLDDDGAALMELE